MSSRKSKGRQKVEMKKMLNESNLQVTFSKRRSGLFKKASELSTLCGIEIAIIVFSPGKKIFSFGHPCVETIVDRFLNQDLSREPSSPVQLIDAYRNANIGQLNMELNRVLDELEFEKKRGEQISQFRQTNRSQFWWESPIENLNMSQLDQLKASLVDLRKDVSKYAENTMVNSLNPAHLVNPHQLANPPPFPNPPNLFVGSSSNGAYPGYGGSSVNNSRFEPNINHKGFKNSGYGRGF